MNFFIIFAVMEHPKFIITSGGHLRLGMVTLHRDLLLPHEQCLGGGFYEFDYAGNILILSGKSFDEFPAFSPSSIIRLL